MTKEKIIGLIIFIAILAWTTSCMSDAREKSDAEYQAWLQLQSD